MHVCSMYQSIIISEILKWKPTPTRIEAGQSIILHDGRQTIQVQTCKTSHDNDVTDCFNGIHVTIAAL